jgi:hypothetical protein
VAEARAAMLSRKKAMLAAYLADAYADRLFAALAEPAGDILAFRAALATTHPPLALVFDLVGGRATLGVEPVQIPISEYDRLGVEDFMVSLYNQHTVQRIRLVTADGRREDVHAVLGDAFEALALVAAPSTGSAGHPPPLRRGG